MAAGSRTFADSTRFRSYLISLQPLWSRVRGTLDFTLPQAFNLLDVVPPDRRERGAGGHWQTWSTSVEAEVNVWLTGQFDKRGKSASPEQQPRP